MTIQTLPRVTQILRDVGLIDTSFMTDAGRERGTAVHQCCEFWDQNDLDMDSVDPAIIGYLDSYREFRLQQPMQGAWIELPMQDKAGLYRGTSDRVLVDRPRAVFDIKTGPYQAWHCLQLSAYVNMLPDPYSYNRIGVYLKANGKYSIKEFPKAEYARDLAVFMSCLNIYNWKEGHNGNHSSQ